MENRVIFFLVCKDRKHLKIQRKILAVKTYLDNGYTSVRVSNIFETSERTVFNWVRHYQNEGIVGLEDRHGRGRKKELTDKNFKKILERDHNTATSAKIVHKKHERISSRHYMI